MNLYFYAFLGSLFAGLATVIGAFSVLIGKKISPKIQDVLLGFSAGIMLAASVFSLIIPALNISENVFHKPFNVFFISFGILCGTFLFLILDKLIPEDYFLKIYENSDAKALKKMWLFVLAITIHNFPEGMSSALGFFKGDIYGGISLAFGIGVQNIPEGMAVALALYLKGFSIKKSILVSLLTGLVEPIGGLVAIAIFTISNYILFFGLAFAGGAMLFIVSKEMIPETHKKGYETEATFGLIAGFIFMMILDTVLS